MNDNLNAEPPSSTLKKNDNLNAEPPSSTLKKNDNLNAEPPSSTVKKLKDEVNWYIENFLLYSKKILVLLKYGFERIKPILAVIFYNLKIWTLKIWMLGKDQYNKYTAKKNLS